MEAKLRKLFSVSEIEESAFLKVIYWLLIFGFFLSFRDWFQLEQVTREAAASGRHLCPPYFLECGSWYFFRGPPESYEFAIFFTGLMGILTLSGLAAWKKRWTLALALLIPLLAFKIFYLFFLNFRAVVEYDYFHIPEVLIFLFASRKRFFLQRIWVLTYLFAATMKFNETWIVGSYFTTLRAGMPMFPNSWVPFITNAVVYFEIFGSWALLSRNRRIRLGSLFLWVLFHLYSIILVGFAYPSYCLPFLLALFLPDDETRDEAPEFSRREWAGWAIMGLLAAISIAPWFMPSDPIYTLQGRRFGVQMFDANHQCLSEEVIVRKSGREDKNYFASPAAQIRCAPYTRLFPLKLRCQDPTVEKIRWKFSASANGGPFYRLVDSENACELNYSHFGANDWIKDPSSGAPVVGYARKNWAREVPISHDDDLIAEKPDPEMLASTQAFFVDHLRELRVFDWLLWTIAILFYSIRAFRRRSSG